MKQRILVAMSAVLTVQLQPNFYFQWVMKLNLSMFVPGNMRMICLGIARAKTEDAEKVSEKLNIKFDVVNFIDFYQQEVVRPMVNGYAMGITPNPDILCNQQMKFGELMKYAQKRDLMHLRPVICIQKLIIKTVLNYGKVLIKIKTSRTSRSTV